MRVCTEYPYLELDSLPKLITTLTSSLALPTHSTFNMHQGISECPSLPYKGVGI